MTAMTAMKAKAIMKRRLSQALVLSVLMCGLCGLPCLWAGIALAEDGVGFLESDGIMSDEVPVYQFPEIKPSGSLWTGFRYANDEGAVTDTYGSRESSPVLGGEIRLFEYPHRAHLDLEIENEHEHFGDARYAYRDIVLIRIVDRSVFHSLPNITLYDLDPSTSSPGVEQRDDADREYGVEAEIHSYGLRVKAPSYPLHVFAADWVFDREGEVQERSLQGSGTYNDMVVVSEDRDVDTEARRLTAGANAHLGPVEAEYSHTEKAFDADGDSVLTDAYSASSLMDEGEYAHNSTPDFEGRADSIKLHSSYTGRFVTAATFTKKDNANNENSALADYFIGAGGVAWSPLTNLLFSLKYTRTTVDVDNPSTVTVEELSDASSSVMEYDTKTSISSARDKVVATGRYIPFKRVTLRAKYTYDDIRRTEAEDWGVPEKSTSRKGLLAADVRLLDSVYLNGELTHDASDSPSYNTDNDTADGGRASVGWTPEPHVTMLLTYGLSRGLRDELEYSDDIAAWDRELWTESIIGTATMAAGRNLSLTFMYAYLDYDITQDILYQGLGGETLWEPGVQLEDMSHVYALTMDYRPIDNLALRAGVTHARSAGEFLPESDDLTEPVSIAEFSRFEATETTYGAGGAYDLHDGYSVDLEYAYTNINDEIDNDYDDVEDGDEHTVVVKLKKKW